MVQALVDLREPPLRSLLAVVKVNDVMPVIDLLDQTVHPAQVPLLGGEEPLCAVRYDVQDPESHSSGDHGEECQPPFRVEHHHQ